MWTRCAKTACVVSSLAALGLNAQVFAADQPGTFFKADLSFVQTAGNSVAGTLGTKANFTENWLRSGFTANAGAVRTETTQSTRTAIGTSQDNMTIQETSVSQISAENYFADAQYSYRLTENFYWFAKGSWTRDRPQGISSRFMEITGFGYDFSKRQDLEFKLNAAATFTEETDLVTNPDPDAQQNFPGIQVSYSYKQKVSSTTTVTHTLAYNQAFSPTKNFWFDGQAGLEVAITRSGTFALKVDARAQYHNMPAVEQLQLTQADGTDTGQQVTNPLKKFDGQFTVGLTVNLSRKGGMTRVTGR